jgi:hypothetical protein
VKVRENSNSTIDPLPLGSQLRIGCKLVAMDPTYNPLSDPAHENHDIDEPANQQPIAILDSMPVKNKMYVFLYGVNPFSPPTPMRFIITTALTAIFFIGYLLSYCYILIFFS